MQSVLHSAFGFAAMHPRHLRNGCRSDMETTPWSTAGAEPYVLGILVANPLEQQMSTFGGLKIALLSTETVGPETKLL